MIGRAVTIGDGKVKINGAPKLMRMVINEGDLVLFQMNSIQMANCHIFDEGLHNEEKVYILNQGDCIARLSSTTVTLKNVQMLGPWVLVEPFADKPKFDIIIPETVDLLYSGVPRFRLIQKSEHSELDAAPGQELIVEKALVTRIELDNKSYGFVDTSRIYGIVESSEPSAVKSHSAA